VVNEHKEQVVPLVDKDEMMKCTYRVQGHMHEPGGFVVYKVT